MVRPAHGTVEMMPYRTLVTDVADAEASLVRLWTENLPVRGDPAAKLRWFYLDAPSGRGEAFVLCDDAGDAVGCAGLATRELCFADRTVRAALLADFVIDRRHRSALPALILQRAVKAHTEGAYDLAYGFPNHNAVAVLKRVGYRELGRMARFVRVLRHAPYLARRFRRGRLGRAVALMLDPASAAVTALRSAPSLARHALCWLDDFDPRFDRLWQRARPRDLIACRRGAELLRWRFARAPGERHAIAGLVARRGGALAAYAVVRGTPDGPAEIADAFGEDLDAFDALFGRIIPALYRRGHTTVGFRYLGDRRLRAVLDRHWFSLREEKRAVIVNLAASCPIAPEIAYDPRSWYLTDLDEDI